jgi:peptidoglycan/LPS O-acetylase OafA/YrhL
MHIKSLTSIRGIASLIVLGGHAWAIFDWPRLLAQNPTPATSVPSAIALFIAKTLNGPAAVEIFFVLSGCVLALSLMHGVTDKPHWVRTFYLKRFFRIYPALWLSIALALGLWPAIEAGLTPAVCSAWAMQVFPAHVTATTVGLSLVPAYVHLNGPIWSLRVEVFYSLLFPAIYLLARSKLSRSALVIGVALLAFIPGIPREYGLHYGLAFALGAAIPFCGAIRAAPYGLLCGVSFACLLYSRIAFADYGMSPKNIENVEMILSAVIIYGLYHSKDSAGFLNNRPLVYLGEISYSLYILHFPATFALAAGLIATFGVPAIQDYPLLFSTLLVLLTVAIVVPLADLSRRFVERSGERLGRGAVRWINEPKDVTVPRANVSSP